jgi:hypothetical protein
MRTSVPENTVFDTNPVYANMTPDELRFIKLLLLEFADQQNIQTVMHMDDTETIDTLEGLARKGAIRIVERANGDLQLLVTPTSAVEAFLIGVR